MLEKRTDLALEVHELKGEESGIKVNEEVKFGIPVTTAEVLQGEGERMSGKRAGKYITADIGRIWQSDNERFNAAARVIADELKSLLPKKQGCVLIVGLGNKYVTPDSVGPRVVEKLLVTHHINSIDPELYKEAGFGDLAAISPGVLGQTGIESAEMVKSVSETLKPACVIIIDALASRRLSRLATTVQISDTGIAPGAGVSNKRTELNSEYLGAPVISMGVPTVVDAATLVLDLLESHKAEIDEAAAEALLSGNGRELFVTPKENDVIAAETASLLAAAVNMAVHGMELSEIKEYIK